MSGEAKQLNGLPEAVGAYTIWGFMPLFFKQLQGVSPVEIVAHRIVWSVVLMVAHDEVDMWCRCGTCSCVVQVVAHRWC